MRSATDYFAFGMEMPGRSFSAKSYRFGFSGKENDNEMKGKGNSIDFGARIYDSRLGRWLSIDPQYKDAPAWSPYRAFFDNPNYWTDLNGNIEWPLKGTEAVDKADLKEKGRNLFNTIIRTSTWREIRNIGSSPHIGIDYRAAKGTPFYSLGDGVVKEIDEYKSGIKYITVQYSNGDNVRFLHIDEVNNDIKVGSQVYEGQTLGKTGNSGTYYDKKAGKYINYQPHLHIDATNSKGEKINPEGKNYGNYTNKEFFQKYEGDYTKLLTKNNNSSEEENNSLFNMILNEKLINQPDKTRVATPTQTESK